MFRHILVPIDLSFPEQGDHNRRALEVAADLGLREGARVTILHVIETIADVPREEMADFYAGIEKRARASMTALVEALDPTLVPEDLRREIAYGRRPREILRRVRDGDVDLLVLHSHPVKRDDPVHGLGTLSHEVALFADCSVMLVKS